MEIKRHCLGLLIPFLSFFLVGCWDVTEIEERAFITAVAIDLAEEEERFEVTEQVIVPAGLGTSTLPGGGKAYRNLTETGAGVFEINRKISRQENRKMNVEHLGLIIVSKELAEEEGMLANILDVFVRQQYVRRGILVVISDGRAKDLLEVEPEHNKIPAQYIIEMIENDESSVTMEPLRVGDVQENLLVDKSYTAPLLRVETKNSIFYEGIAVIADTPSILVGILTADDAKGRHYIIGQSQEGTITMHINGEPTTFEIIEGKSDVTLRNRDKNELEFKIDIEVTAALREYFGTDDFYNRDVLNKFKMELEKEVERIAYESIRVIKDGYQVDIFHLGMYLRIHHYNLWQEVKDEWDRGENYFANSNIHVDVTVNLIEPGTSVQVNSEED